MRKIFLLGSLVFYFILVFTISGFCKESYPDGFDGVKWWMSYDEMVKTIKDEGRQDIIFDCPDGRPPELKSTANVFGMETEVSYGFYGGQLGRIFIKLPEVRIEGTQNSYYVRLKEKLVELYGEPAETENRGGYENYAKWKYPDGNTALEVATDFLGYAGNIHRVETRITISPPEYAYDKSSENWATLNASTRE